MLEKITKKIDTEVKKLLAKETLTADELHFLCSFARDLENKETKNQRDEQIKMLLSTICSV